MSVQLVMQRIPHSQWSDCRADVQPVDGNKNWQVCNAGQDEKECQEEGLGFQRMLVDLGPLAMFGELNASRYSDAELAERGLSGGQAPGCRRTLALKPYGEQSEPDDPFPVFSGELLCK